MSGKTSFEEARDRSARAAKVRRVRLFILGAIAGSSMLAATAWIALTVAPKPSWTPITSPPPKHMVVVVMRQDGEWRTCGGATKEAGMYAASVLEGNSRMCRSARRCGYPSEHE